MFNILASYGRLQLTPNRFTAIKSLAYSDGGYVCFDEAREIKRPGLNRSVRRYFNVTWILWNA